MIDAAYTVVKNECDTKVRLESWQLAAIREAFKISFLPVDHLWLFGSRVDLTLLGGDIDLYVETCYNNADLVAKARSNFYSALMMKIGDQKVDIVVKFDRTDLLVYRIAHEEGIQLV